MRKITSIVIYPVILAVSAASGFLLLVLAYRLPADPIQKNILSGANVLVAEGDEFEFAEGYKASILDNFTDALMLNETAVSTGDAVNDAAMVPAWSFDDDGSGVTDLLGFLNHDTRAGSYNNYPRYWHGYLIFLTPLFLIFDYSDLRMIHSAGVLALLVLLVWSVITRHPSGAKLLIPLTVLMIFWNPCTISLSLQYSACYTISMIAAVIACRHPFMLRPAVRSNCFFLFTGIATAYFDFLTYPIATLGLPLVLLLSAELEPYPAVRQEVQQLKSASSLEGGRLNQRATSHLATLPFCLTSHTAR